MRTKMMLKTEGYPRHQPGAGQERETVPWGLKCSQSARAVMDADGEGSSPQTNASQAPSLERQAMDLQKESAYGVSCMCVIHNKLRGYQFLLYSMPLS